MMYVCECVSVRYLFTSSTPTDTKCHTVGNSKQHTETTLAQVVALNGKSTLKIESAYFTGLAQQEPENLKTVTVNALV